MNPDWNKLEEGSTLQLDFQKLKKVAEGRPVLPVVVQAVSGEVLTLAYADQEALRLSLAERKAVFFSTSRQEIWRKGATSGDELILIEVRVNCEQNSLLYIVEKKGKGVCHTRDSSGNTRSTCYYRKIEDSGLSFVK